ncbi:MAG: hypothetical protein RLY20_3330, partial [Verrucomicrobiota bacterium]
MTNRQLFRRRDRSLVRRNVRRAVRCRWRAPDYLALALRACQRLLRCNRELARLVPEFFDPVIVDRLARERAEKLRWRAEWEPALRKVYGESADPEPEPDLLPPLPSPRVQRRVDALLAERQQWLTLGTLNLRRFHERRPQKVASLGQLARLLWAAVQLGRWAAGIPDHPEPPTPAAPDPWADLARIYPEPPAPSP